ncbi:hypothetical protein HY009_01535, partial [Candidatus Acetothermia bacterium]|nr:hypothetical protein [Candidatus Acetothermia bacterium]
MNHKKIALGTVALIGIFVAVALLMTSTVPMKAHDVSLIKKTIKITMDEFSFTVDGVKGGAVNLKVGDTVTLIFENKGKVLHDAHFGTDADLKGRFFKKNIVAPFDMLVLEANERAQLTFTPTDPG